MLFYLVLKTKILLSIQLFLATCEVYNRTRCHSLILFVLRYICPFKINGFDLSTNSQYLWRVSSFDPFWHMRYKTSVKPGPDQRIYLHVVSWNLGVPRVECGSGECGVRSAECGIDKEECNLYGVGKTGSIKIWRVEKRTETNR